MQLIKGDCLERLREMDECSVDSIVTDPPYGISFMGKKWDYDVPSVEVWAECLRVLKPGGHLLAFAGTRTQHRMAVRIEDAGFDIRDMIAWVYGSGFPKSLDVSKAIDKAAGAEREVVGQRTTGIGTGGGSTPIMGDGNRDITAPATEAAKQWEGWGTALKPAMEPITVARKPLIGTVAENVLQHGTGAINVDGCRVGTDAGWSYPNGRGGSGWHGRESLATNLAEPMAATQGRWPANFIHDGSDEVVGMFPVTTSGSGKPRVERTGDSTKSKTGGLGIEGGRPIGFETAQYGDSGSAARFFYCAKASKADRDEGCEGLPQTCASKHGVEKRITVGGGKDVSLPRGNHHPTVKPTDLMRYLCRIVTPSGGTVLDPFMGSGSTGKAALLEGFDFIGIERDCDYIKIAEARIQSVKNNVLLDNDL